DGVPALEASLAFPYGVAVGPDGKLYFSDGHNHRVRRIEPDGTIITVAGTGEAGETGDGGPATQAQILHPRGLVFDKEGRLYIGTHGGSRIRMIDTDGVISTVVESDGQNLDLSADGDLYINRWKVDLSRWSEQGLEILFEAGAYVVKGPGADEVLPDVWTIPANFGIDPQGHIFISDENVHRVYWIQFP
ncbi:MAG: NHL domain-containing protein, partial [Actinomycetota bacterium]